MAEPERPQVTITYGACAVRAEQLTLQTHTQNMHTEIVVMRTRVNATFIRTLPVLFTTIFTITYFVNKESLVTQILTRGGKPKYF